MNRPTVLTTGGTPLRMRIQRCPLNVFVLDLHHLAALQMRLKLARVEMPPHTLLRMIHARQQLLTLGTGPARVAVPGPQIDALCRRLELHRAMCHGACRPRIVSNSLVAALGVAGDGEKCLLQLRWRPRKPR